MKLHSLALTMGVLLCASVVPCRASEDFVMLASTIGPIDAGIVQALEDAFERDTGTRVRHVGAGTGAALDIARKGNIDLVLVHARSLEEKFVREGFGTERIALMYNDFVILGPASDPAGVGRTRDVKDAFGRIADKQALFVTRGDKSGTHVAEMDLWGKAGVAPGGSWYETYARGAEGNGPTLKYADEKQAYIFMDRATYLTMKSRIRLVILLQKDEALLNYMSLIPVDPRKFPKVNHASAMRFVEWLVDPQKGQQVIRDFGKEKYGEPLFFPNSDAWSKRGPNK